MGMCISNKASLAQPQMNVKYMQNSEAKQKLADDRLQAANKLFAKLKDEAGEGEEVVAFFVDESLGGPLCPLFLLARLTSPPLPAISPMMQRRQTTLIPRSPLPVVSPPPWKSRAISLQELRKAACRTQLGSDVSHKLSAELIDALIHDGILRLSTSEAELALVQDAHKSAASFFDLSMQQKNRLSIGLSNGGHAGFRAEGAREFFAIRRVPPASDPWHVSGPELLQEILSTWGSLFVLQRQAAKDVAVLVAQGAGIEASVLTAVLDDGPDPLCDRASFPGIEDASPPAILRSVDDVGADVMRIYRIQRPRNAARPGFATGATSAHTDVGLVTVSPSSNLPGLVALHPTGLHWSNVEAEGQGPGSCLVAFLGETMARLLSSPASKVQGLRAPVHLVDERFVGLPRFSTPFFLRARPDAMISPGMTTLQFLETLGSSRPWFRLTGRPFNPLDY